MVGDKEANYADCMDAKSTDGYGSMLRDCGEEVMEGHAAMTNVCWELTQLLLDQVQSHIHPGGGSGNGKTLGEMIPRTTAKGDGFSGYSEA